LLDLPPRHPQVHVPLLLLTPLIALYGIWSCYMSGFNPRTVAFAVFYYALSGLGITAGYHRCFAHKAYKARPPLFLLLVLMGSAAVEGSVHWWARDHRAHHKYVDTPRDPYAATKGFWFAHLGWMLVRQDKNKIGKADISDLDANWLIRFQHKYYAFFALIMGFIVPTLVCGLGWGDYWGGYFLAGVARLVFVHHSTFFVNSLAHYAGAATYTDQHSARNSLVTALLTLGEGYHNFHHEFPNDYRNAIEWYQYDPTKLFIAFFAALGQAYDLRQFPRNVTEKGALQMRQKALDLERAAAAAAGAPPAPSFERRQRELDIAMKALNWGPSTNSLPEWSPAEFDRRVAAAAAARAAGEVATPVLVVIDGFILDVKPFVASHPGGARLILDEAGKDISELFKGAAYKHSNAAQNMQCMYRIARLQGYWGSK
jgi:stearoyl-CoA desaturase (delta-9 desaturase)